MPKERAHGRSDGQSQISISLPKSLLEDVDSLATAENRSRSNWIVTELQKLVSEKLGKKIHALPDAAPAADRSSDSIAALRVAEETASSQRSPRGSGAGSKR